MANSSVPSYLPTWLRCSTPSSVEWVSTDLRTSRQSKKPMATKGCPVGVGTCGSRRLGSNSNRQLSYVELAFHSVSTCRLVSTDALPVIESEGTSGTKKSGRYSTPSGVHHRYDLGANQL